jgi:predicted enzyme related to lactoylglutathione lyase
MKNKMTHFAIHIDNLERAKNFYGQVFDWGFASYGAPAFYKLRLTTPKTEN